MAKIFISYKRVDIDKVLKIKDQIESALGEKVRYIKKCGLSAKKCVTNAVLSAEFCNFVLKTSAEKCI